MNDQLRSFSCNFVHDKDHRRVLTPVADGPLPIANYGGDVAPPPPPLAGPTEAPPSFFILGVLNALDVLDGLMALCFFVCLFPRQ